MTPGSRSFSEKISTRPREVKSSPVLTPVPTAKDGVGKPGIVTHARQSTCSSVSKLKRYWPSFARPFTRSIHSSKLCCIRGSGGGSASTGGTRTMLQSSDSGSSSTEGPAGSDDSTTASETASAMRPSAGCAAMQCGVRCRIFLASGMGPRSSKPAWPSGRPSTTAGWCTCAVTAAAPCGCASAKKPPSQQGACSGAKPRMWTLGSGWTKSWFRRAASHSAGRPAWGGTTTAPLVAPACWRATAGRCGPTGADSTRSRKSCSASAKW
mmetsp:Transcript_56133/g.166950  ORF Transcript_56133/g.166950 Transcript_56133/m.166950 type:complete len:267 (-) Transcript_56133:61-861(-)